MLVGKNIVLEEIDFKNIEWIRQRRNNPYIRQFFREWKDISAEKQELWYKERGSNMSSEHICFQIMAMPNCEGTLLSKSSLEEAKKSAPDCFIEMETRDRISNRFISGCCYLSYIDWHTRSAEFGIFVDTVLRGRGVGKEALTIMVDYAFKEANLHKVWAEVWDNNESIKIYRKVGFKDEGISRDAYFHNGKYGNSYMLSVLENEWLEIYGKDPLWDMDPAVCGF